MLEVPSVASIDVQMSRLAAEGSVMISRVGKEVGRLATGVGGGERARSGRGESERGEGEASLAGGDGGMQANAGVFKGDSPSEKRLDVIDTEDPHPMIPPAVSDGTPATMILVYD